MARYLNTLSQAAGKNGQVLVGATLGFFEAGPTSTKLDTFQDEDLTIANANPVVADGEGRFPDIFLKPQKYFVEFRDAGGTLKDSQDNVTGPVIGSNSLENIAEMTALVKSTLLDGDSFPVDGYTTRGDGGEGRFFFDSSSTETTNLGTIFATDEGGTGRWKREIDDIITIHMFGGFSGANVTTQFLSALQFFRDRGTSIALTLPVITAFQGGILDFPFGNYTLDFDIFEIDDIMNLTLRGEGAGVEQNFGLPITKLVFTGTSSGFGFRVVFNGARGFRIEGIAVEYADANFTGNLVELENLVSFSFRDVRFQHQVDGNRVYTAASLINLKGDTKFGEIDFCSFDEADKGLITTAFGGNEPKEIATTNTVFNDLQTAQVDIPNGEQAGFSFINTTFNPVNLKTTGTPVVNGLKIGGSGWLIQSCVFGGSTNDAVPSANFADLSGSGKYLNNVMLTNEVGIVNRGTVDFSSNKTSARIPLTLESGSFTTGGGNIYSPLNSPTDAVSISPSSGSVILDIGPDIIESGFTNSYNVVTDSSSTNGVIKYSRGKDASTNGPTLVSEHVKLKSIDVEEFVKTTDYTVKKEETGCTFNNAGAGGTVIFTLPTAVAGLEYTFYKFTNQTMTITAGGGDVFIKAAAAGDSSLTNTVNELGAVVKIRAVSSSSWLVESISGTWT